MKVFKILKGLFFTIFMICLLSFQSKQKETTIKAATDDSLKYQRVISRIKIQGDSIKTICRKDSSKIEIASRYLFQCYYNEIVPSWIGTKWEFYEKTEIPHKGAIACGYFVVNSLKGLDLRLEDPIGMAEDYSAYIISTLCDSSFKTKKPEELLSAIRKHADDVWIVGLSNHSGILIKSKGRIYFIHSSVSLSTDCCRKRNCRNFNLISIIQDFYCRTSFF